MSIAGGKPEKNGLSFGRSCNIGTQSADLLGPLPPTPYEDTIHRLALVVFTRVTGNIRPPAMPREHRLIGQHGRVQLDAPVLCGYRQ